MKADDSPEPLPSALAELRVAEAAFRLEPSERTRADVVAAAVRFLVEGRSTPNLDILAGEDHADLREVERYLDASLRDLGLLPLDTVGAALTLLDSIARELVGGHIEPPDAAQRLIAAVHVANSLVAGWAPKLPPEAEDLVAVAWELNVHATPDDLRATARAYLDRGTATPRRDIRER